MGPPSAQGSARGARAALALDLGCAVRPCMGRKFGAVGLSGSHASLVRCSACSDAQRNAAAATFLAHLPPACKCRWPLTQRWHLCKSVGAGYVWLAARLRVALDRSSLHLPPHLPGTALHRLWQSHLPCGRVATGRELPASGTRRYSASGPLGCRYNPQYDQIIITASSDCNVCPPPTPSAPRTPRPLLSPLVRALPSPCPHARHGVVNTAD